WASPLMGNRHDPDPILEIEVDEGVRKAPERAVAHARFILNRIKERIFAHALQRCFKFLAELATEPNSLLLIVFDGALEFGLGIHVDGNGLHGKRSLSSARTSSIGRPGASPLRIWATRRVISARQACSTPSSSGSREASRR